MMSTACAPAVITASQVLTAAHCVTPALDGSPDPVVVLADGGQGQVWPWKSQRLGSRSLVHPGFQVSQGSRSGAGTLIVCHSGGSPQAGWWLQSAGLGWQQQGMAANQAGLARALQLWSQGT
jgi:hypothetical protein